MSPRRDARRLENVLLPRAAAPPNRPQRVVRMPAVPGPSASRAKEVFTVCRETSEEQASPGTPHAMPPQTILRMPGTLARVAEVAMEAAKPVAQRAWTWLCTQAGARLRHSLGQPKTRRLRLAETLSLGEKRFVSLVEVDGQAFLIGGSASGVSLLAECQGKRAEASFGSAMAEARWPERERA